jgi:hypothetical protein
MCAQRRDTDNFNRGENSSHLPLTLWLKTDWRTPTLACFFRNFWSWPLVLDSVFILKVLEFILAMLFPILNTCNMSPLLLWYSKYGSDNALSRSTYEIPISLVACLSTATLSRRNLGYQMELPFSRCGQTIVGNSRWTVTSSRHVKVALTSPSMPDALLTAFATRLVNEHS